MADKSTTKYTVTSNEQFIEELCETYPSANSVSQALLYAAQDGVDFRQAIGNDLESFVREIATDELEQSDAPRYRADD